MILIFVLFGCTEYNKVLLFFIIFYYFLTGVGGGAQVARNLENRSRLWKDINR